MKSSGATFGRVESVAAGRSFPIVSLVNAILATLAAATWTSLAFLAAASPSDDGRAASMWAIEAGAFVVAGLAWLALVGRRRGWNEYVAFLLGSPALFLNLLTAIGVVFALFHVAA